MSDRRVTRRDFLWIGAMGATASLMAACGAPVPPTPTPQAAAPAKAAAPSEPTKAPAPTVAEKAAAAKGPVTLRFLLRHYQSFGPQWDWIVSSYQKKNPNVKVEIVQNPAGCELDKLLIMVSAGDQVDTYWTCGDTFVGLATKGVLKKLNPFFTMDKTFKVDDYVSTFFELYKQKDGSIYSVPWLCFTFMIFYNKDIFDKEKVPYPDPKKPMTWDETLELAKKLTRWTGSRPEQLGGFVSGSTAWTMWAAWLAQAGIPFWKPDMSGVNLDNPEAWQVLDWFAEWQWKHKVNPSAAFQTDIPFGFNSGNVAMWIAAEAQWNGTKKAAAGKFKWDIAPFPQRAGTKRQVYGYGDTVVMMNASRYPDESWGFLKEACGPEAYLMLYDMATTIPSLKTHINPPHPTFVNSRPPDNNLMVLEDLEYLMLPYPGNSGAYSAVSRIVNNALNPVYVGKMTAKEAMTQAMPDIQRTLKELKDTGLV
ncbi:MAG: sugar ABC transporter substrate-binding protein [Chloroflexi bacterium]|nr:sugar ABC transporter substrate-binding protein [Chloroflexota bacterium]